MTRSLAMAVLALLLAVMPVVRYACDLACVPAPRSAAAAPVSHCAPPAPAPAPAAPVDSCHHDHHEPPFVTAAGVLVAPEAGVATVMSFPQTGPQRAFVLQRAARVRRAGPLHTPRPFNLRI